MKTETLSPVHAIDTVDITVTLYVSMLGWKATIPCVGVFFYNVCTCTQMRYQEQQKLQKHQKAEMAEHYLKDIDLKTVTGKDCHLILYKACHYSNLLSTTPRPKDS